MFELRTSNRTQNTNREVRTEKGEENYSYRRRRLSQRPAADVGAGWFAGTLARSLRPASVCAALLHSGEIDLGLIPSIEYLQSPDYRFVPGVGIGSRGPIASVALYTRVPVERHPRDRARHQLPTSVTLIRVLCHHRFRVAPGVRRRMAQTSRR